MNRLYVTLTALALTACDRNTPAPVTTPRAALDQLLRCTFDGLRGDPTPSRLEGAMRHALHATRGRFATRAGVCESALDTPGGRHPCLAGLRTRWSSMLVVVQRPTPDAIDDDVAVRRVGEAYTDAQRNCP